MQLWPVAHFFSFCHHFWVGATAKQQQTHPKVMTEWKKWATGQSYIREEVTSYKIHTLEIHPEQKFWPLFNANNIFLALLKYQTLYNIILVFSNFVRGQWQKIWIWAQFLYVFGKKKGFSCPFFQLLFLGFLLCFKIISDSVKFAVICKRSLARNLDLFSVFLCFCQKIIFMAIFLTFSIGIFLYFFQKHFSFPWHLPAICQDVGRNDISSSDFSNFFLPSQFLTNFWNFEGLLKI